MASEEKASRCESCMEFKLEQDVFLDVQGLFRCTANTNCDVLYVISNIDNVQITKYWMMPGFLSDNTELTEKTKFVLGDHTVFLDICKKRRNIHLLEYIEKENTFKWIESSIGANVNDLRLNGMTKDTCKFDYDKDRPVTIIYAGYGSGKTVFLKHMKSTLVQRNHNTSVFLLDDTNIAKYCNNFKDKNLNNFGKFFAIDLNHEDVHLMFDNIEDFSACDQMIKLLEEIHLNYRNVKLWITCSDNGTRNILESKLGTFSCYFSILMEMSHIYLKEYWEIDESDENDKHIEYVFKICNKWFWKEQVVNNSTIKYSKLFNTNRLHLKMIATLFNPMNKIKLSEINILKFYDDFIRYYYTDKNLEELAIMKLCKDVDFKLNITQENESLPKNKNLVSYLAAKWFSKNFQVYREELKNVFESRCCPWSFYYFFNCFLAKGHPLHTAVLSNQYLELGATKENINDKDAGGRTPLHLVHHIDSLRMIFLCNPDVTITDNVLQWTAMQYYDFNYYLTCLNYLLHHSDECKKIKLTSKLNESEVTKRLRYSIVSNKLPQYVKLICEEYQHLNICPETLIHLFIDMPPDISMMVLKCVTKTNISYVCDSRKTALFYAVKQNNMDAVKYLIDTLSFDVYHRCDENTTVIHEALKHKHTAIAKYLLEIVTDINMRYGSDNSTAFIDCCRYDNVEVLKFLLSKCAESNIMLLSGETPIQIACNNGSARIIKYFLKNKNNLNITYDIDYGELLHRAVRISDKNLVELILQEKVENINKVINGKTVLHLAAEKSSNMRVDIIKLLLREGADVNATDDNGNLPLFNMEHDIQCKVSELLSSNKYNFLHVNNEGETILHVFTKQSIKKKLSQRVRNYITDTMIYLIYNGADVNARNSSGDTPLMLACRNSNIMVARFLVKIGAKVDITNNKGETPLHLSCLSKMEANFNNFKTCLFLIQKGSDVNRKTNSGKTPLMYAACSFPKNINRLVKHGADIFCKDNNNKTLIHYCAAYGLLNQLNLLWELGLRDGKSIDNLGKTPLHYAVRENHINCYEYLLRHFQTDSDIVDNDGKRAFDLSTDTRFRKLINKHRYFPCSLI